MQQQATVNENKMGVMPVNRLLLSMSLPMMISMLVQALYNVVDSIFVSQISEEALTAVSLAFPYQNLMISIGAGTGVGINALLSKSLGEKNIEEANNAANNGIFLGFLNFILFLVLGLTISRIFFQFQTDDPVIIEQGFQYLFICSVFSFGIFGQMVFERLLQSTGKTFYTMITQGIGAVINIILDPILIFGLLGFPRLGVAGAAIATIFGQIVGFLLAVWFNVKKNKDIHIQVKGFRPKKRTIQRIYAVGVPSIMMTSISSVMTFGMNKILMGFTSTAAAVFGVYFKLQSFIFMPVFGLNNGMVPIISYNYGAQKKERLIKTIQLSVIYSMSIMAVGFLIFQIFPLQLLSLFKASDDMVNIGVVALRSISPSFLCAGYCIIIASVFQALGNGMQSLLVSVIRQLFVLLPSAYFLSLTGNLNLVWLAFPIAELAAVTLCSIYLKRTYSRVIKPIPSAK